MQLLTRLLKSPVSDDHSALVPNLIYLRLLVLAAAIALLFLAQVYDQNLSLWPGIAGIVIAVLSWSGLALMRNGLLQSRHAAVREIAIDFAWVFCVVFLSGRSANPFIYYYLVLIAICASIFPARTAWLFCVGGIAAYTGLLWLDIGAHFEHMSERYRLHLAGMWLNYVGSSIVTCYFVSRLAKLISTQQLELAQAREENLKNEQLIGIGTLAASTVHALATPLSTLNMLAEDMGNDRSIKPALREDFAIIRAQVHRCTGIMKNLSKLAQSWPKEGPISAGHLKQELESYYSLQSPGREPRFTLEQDSDSCQVQGNLLLQHALINLINNAVESERASAQVNFSRRGRVLNIRITNETGARPEAVLQRWGRPQSSEKGAGLGIGSFLANSTIEKLGGTVQLHADPLDGRPEATQVTVTVSLPMECH